MYTRKLLFLIFDILCGVFGGALMTFSSMIISVCRDISEARDREVVAGAILILFAGVLLVCAAFIGLAGAILDHSKLCLCFFVVVVIAMVFALAGMIITLYYRKDTNRHVHYRPVELGDETTSIVFHYIEKNSKCCGYTGPENYLGGEDLLNVPNVCCNASAGEKKSKDCVNKSGIFDVEGQTSRFYWKGCRDDVVNYFKLWGLINSIFAGISIVIAGVTIYFVNKYKGTPHY